MLTTLRRHPYRALFPIGWLLFAIGVLPWVFAGLVPELGIPRDLHALVLVQGGLTAFAAGFLFTMLPRRLEGPAPSAGLMLLALLVPFAHLVAIGFGGVLAAHLVWLPLALGLLIFAARLVLTSRGGRTGPAAYLWLPVGWAMGGGGALIAVLAELDVLEPVAGNLGWLLVTQGLFLCLVLGVGALFVPLTANKEGCPDAADLPQPALRRVLHLTAAAAIVLGFVLEVRGRPDLGRGLRGLVTLIVLVTAARLHRLPRVAGTQRKLIWLAAWCVPVGHLLAAALPGTPHVGLHLFLLGGIGLITLTVALHVGLAHSGGQELVHRPVGAVRLFGGLFLAGLVLRLALEVLPLQREACLALAAGLVLASLVPWGALVLPRLVAKWIDGHDS